MSKQYRYKTAADQKEFFKIDWFKRLDDAFVQLNDAIAKDYKSKNNDAWSKIKETFSGSSDKMVSWIDAYILPSDGGQHMMDVLDEYEEWYTNAWTFLDQDDYDKVKESLRKCDTIEKSIKKFAGGNDAKLLLEGSGPGTGLGEIYNNVISLIGKRYDRGTDKSNNDKIKVFLDSLEDSSGTFGKLEAINEVIVDFAKDLSENENYWALASQDGSELLNHVKEVREQIKSLASSKKDSEDGKDTSEEGKGDGKVKKDVFGIDTVTAMSNRMVSEVENIFDLVNEILKEQYKEEWADYDELGLTKESGKDDWKDLVNKSVVQFLDGLKERFNEKAIRTEDEKGKLDDYFKNNRTKIKELFNDKFDVLMNTYENNEHIGKLTMGKIDGLEKLREYILYYNDKLYNELKGHI